MFFIFIKNIVTAAYRCDIFIAYKNSPVEMERRHCESAFFSIAMYVIYNKQFQ